MVIADTGSNYSQLDRWMYKTAVLTKLTIDTLGRHYDSKKKSIVLADDDEDEMYRGEYYPKRNEDTCFLSLEHYNQYITGYNSNTIALVADICTTRPRADSLANALNPVIPGVFVVKAAVYMGCMH